jgi:hypothetical protein
MHIKTIRSAVEFVLDNNYATTIKEREDVLRIANNEFSLDCSCEWEQTGVCDWYDWVDETLYQVRKGVK